MKTYRIPFDYSCSTQIKKKAAQGKKFCDTPEKYFTWLYHEVAPGYPKYLIVGQQRDAYIKYKPRNATAATYEAWEDKYAGQTAFVICPGPSLGAVPVEAFARKLTFGVNAAGFRVPPRYWVAAEWEWGHWLYKLKHDEFRRIGAQLDRQDWWATPRAAIYLWRRKFDFPALPLYRRVIVSALEEERAVPFPVDGTTAYNAIAAAWWMGCARCVVFGMDLRKDAGAYVKGVPVSAAGVANPYDAQIRAMRQCRYPGMEIFNASLVSQDLGLPFTPLTPARALEMLAEAPEVDDG